MTSRPPIELKVTPEQEGERLDRLVRAAIPDVSRGSIRRLIERGLVFVDGRACRKGQRLRAGQRVLVAASATDERPVPQPEMQLETIAVTAAIVVLNKPHGHASHPLVPAETDTLANALVARFPECSSASPHAREGGLVHRLDWSTSGVIVAARSRAAYGRLRALFKAGEVAKEYLALVTGALERSGAVTAPLQTSPDDRRRVKVARPDRGQSARTEYTPVARLGELTLARARSLTGRRHQVRAHLAAIGHPLVGDALYGGSVLDGVEGAFLHASRIELGGEVYEALLPPDRREILARLDNTLEV